MEREAGQRRRQRNQAGGPGARWRTVPGSCQVAFGQAVRRVLWAGPPQGREKSPWGGWRRRAVWVRAVGWPPGFESLGGCRGSGRPVVGLGGAIGWCGGTAPIRGSRRVEVRWCGHAGLLAGPGHGRGRPRYPYPWSGSAGGGRGVRYRRVSATALRVAGRRVWWGRTSAGLVAEEEPAEGLSAGPCTGAGGRGSCVAMGRRPWQRL